MLSFWTAERDRFECASTALSFVLAHKLAPIACTTALLVSGLSLFLMSSFPPLADFGRLSILALSTALVATVCVLPPLLLVMLGEGVRVAAAPAREAPASVG